MVIKDVEEAKLLIHAHITPLDNVELNYEIDQ